MQTEKRVALPKNSIVGNKRNETTRTLSTFIELDIVLSLLDYGSAT